MRIRAITAIAALTGAAVLIIAAPVQAHSYLVASTPDEGETLTALPDEFSVTANETLLDLQAGGTGSQGAFALQIRDADGGYYGDGCVTVTDATMSADAVLGESGAYTMLWQVVSADGHPVSGEIPFTWSAPDGFDAGLAHDAAPVCGEDPAALPTPNETAEPASPWILPITVVLAVLVLILAMRSARIQLRDRAAARGDDSERPPTG